MDTIQTLRKVIVLASLSTFSSFLATPVYAKPYMWHGMIKPSLEAGIMAGYTGGNRNGVVTNLNTGTAVHNGGSQDSSEIGAQLRLLFGSEYHTRFFLYLNGIKPIGAPVSIATGQELPPNTTNVRLTLTSNWLGRLGMGVSTPWLYDTFQLGLGTAGAVINQTLKTYVASADYSYKKTALRPSLMGNVTWNLCKQCVGGHRSFIAAQLTADYNPNIYNTVPSSLGNLRTGVHQAWVPRGDIILSVGFG